MEGILAQVSAASEGYDLHPREGVKKLAVRNSSPG
jgi:hypothetical protein